MFKKLTALTVFILFISSGIYIASAQESKLSDSVLRLHVIANSDDPNDQALKIEVKDEIVCYMQSEFKDVKDVKEARKLAQKDSDKIQKIAENKIHSCGYNYPVKVYIGEFDFPLKSYGNMVFPAGKYQAVRVVIGKGAGKNWWCVLFPPLCLVSSSDRGMSLKSIPEAQITFKCLELLPKGVHIVNQ
jgi:stage II sporulation protein R